MGAFLVSLAVLLAPFALVGALALRQGAESRPGFDERPYDGRPNL